MRTIRILSLPRRSIRVQTLLFICIFLVSCSKVDSSDSNKSTDFFLPLEESFQDIQLMASVPATQVITLHVPPEIKRLESARIDIPQTLKNASVSYQKGALKSAIINATLKNNETGWILIKVGDSPEAAPKLSKLWSL